MSSYTLEPAPIELLVLLEQASERPQWLRAAHRAGVLLTTSNDTTELLSQFSAAVKPPDAILIPLGAREEEALLLFRALVKRQSRRHTCSIFFLDRGARILRTHDDAVRFGAEGLLPDLPFGDVLAAVLSRIDIPLEAEVPEDWEVVEALPQTPPPQPPPRGHADFSRSSTNHTRPSPRPPPIPQRGSLMRVERGASGGVVAAEQWLRGIMKKARAKSYFELLGQGPEATMEGLHEAFSELMQRLSGQLPAEVASSHSAELEELRQVLADAWTVLGHPARLEAYRKAVTKYGS